MHERSLAKSWGRWVATFVGFPLAGVTARAAAGNIDAASAAAVGGLVGGVALGAVQAWIGGVEADARVRWAAATAAGLGAGLTAGAALVGYRTDTASLVAMGAVSGAGVGIAQAIAMPPRTSDRIAWAVATPALWAAGWLITSQVIVDADRQHAMFGASGAVVVAILSGALHARRHRAASAPSVAAASDRLAA